MSKNIETIKRPRQIVKGLKHCSTCGNEMQFIRNRKVYCGKKCRQWVMNRRLRRPCVKCGALCYKSTHGRCRNCFHADSKELARSNLKDRFMAKINKTDTCWLWTGAKNNNGYGNLSLNRKTTLCNRIAYELFNGPIPPRMNVLHTCDIPACVHPRHLYIGTQSQNLKDAYNRGRRSKKCLKQKNQK